MGKVRRVLASGGELATVETTKLDVAAAELRVEHNPERPMVELRPEAANTKKLSRDRVFRATQICVVLAFGFTIWRLAWMSDDALISVRSALNAYHGMGLGFNADERVQAFTHPLWFGVIWLTGALSGSWIYGVLFLSVALSTAAGAVVVGCTRRRSRLLIVAAGLLLANSVVEFATSGLEGPLAALLVSMLFAVTMPRRQPFNPAVVGLLVAGIALTRLDLLIIVAPFLGWLAWKERHDVRCLVKLSTWAAAPLILWFGSPISTSERSYPRPLMPRPTRRSAGANCSAAVGTIWSRVSSSIQQHC